MRTILGCLAVVALIGFGGAPAAKAQSACMQMCAKKYTGHGKGPAADRAACREQCKAAGGPSQSSKPKKPAKGSTPG